MNKVLLLVVLVALLLVASTEAKNKKHGHKKSKIAKQAAKFDPAELAFENFVRHYHKVYTPEEKERRLANFRKNWAELPTLRKQNPHAKFGVTQFFDMSKEEFKNYSCGGNLNRFKPKHHLHPIAEMPKDAAPPAAWDWQDHGAVTPVKNQEQCGSCWAFSTVGNLEGAWFLAGNNLTSLSEQEFVDCSTESDGCSGGWPFWAMSDILSQYKGVVDTEASYPYTALDGTCSVSSGKPGAKYSAYKIFCNEQTAKCSETDMVNLLYSSGPLSACLDATPFMSYTSGILDPQNCDPTYIDHCITITGYGSENGVDFWRIKNSWGTSWGEAGYVRLVRGKGACGINVAITMASISSTKKH